MGWGGFGGRCDFSVSLSPFGLDFGTLDFGTSDSGLPIVDCHRKLNPPAQSHTMTTPAPGDFYH